MCMFVCEHFPAMFLHHQFFHYAIFFAENSFVKIKKAVSIFAQIATIACSPEKLGSYTTVNLLVVARLSNS